MALAHLTMEALKAMRKHGHPEFWEVAIYANSEDKKREPHSVTLECTKCGEVLVELVNPDLEVS
jgi:hypothetical protein